MQVYDLAIPILPSRSIVETAGFYKRLGFEGGPHEYKHTYVIACRGDVELHFFLTNNWKITLGVLVPRSCISRQCTGRFTTGSRL